MIAFILYSIGLIIGGYLLGARYSATVKADLAAAKSDIEALKAKVTKL